jgi:hypothetical protein
MPPMDTPPGCDAAAGAAASAARSGSAGAATGAVRWGADCTASLSEAPAGGAGLTAAAAGCAAAGAGGCGAPLWRGSCIVRNMATPITKPGTAIQRSTCVTACGTPRHVTSLRDCAPGHAVCATSARGQRRGRCRSASPSWHQGQRRRTCRHAESGSSLPYSHSGKLNSRSGVAAAISPAVCMMDSEWRSALGPEQGTGGQQAARSGPAARVAGVGLGRWPAATLLLTVPLQLLIPALQCFYVGGRGAAWRREGQARRAAGGWGGGPPVQVIKTRLHADTASCCQVRLRERQPAAGLAPSRHSRSYPHMPAVNASRDSEPGRCRAGAGPAAPRQRTALAPRRWRSCTVTAPCSCSLGTAPGSG